MAERLVTIATFNEATEAHILKGRLEAEGILCFLGDEHIVGAHPFYAVAVGGVKLKVTESDVNDAKAILQSIREGDALFDYDTIDLAKPEEAEKQLSTCPRCKSEHTKEKTSLLKPLLGEKYKCLDCGYTWRR